MAQMSSGNPFYLKQGDVGCKWPGKSDQSGVIRTFSARGGGALINYLPALPAILGLFEALKLMTRSLIARLLRDPDAFRS